MGGGKVLLEHDPRAAALIGVDVGNGAALIVVSDLDGQLLHQRRVALSRHDSGASVDVLVDSITALVDISTADGIPVRAVGIGVPGVTDTDRGVAIWVPSLGWSELPLQQVVEERTGLPTWIDNNVNLGALGEQWRGAGRGLRDIVYLFIGPASAPVSW